MPTGNTHRPGSEKNMPGQLAEISQAEVQTSQLRLESGTAGKRKRSLSHYYRLLYSSSKYPGQLERKIKPPGVHR